jgi:group I intron endonuclease
MKDKNIKAIIYAILTDLTEIIYFKDGTKYFNTNIKNKEIQSQWQICYIGSTTKPLQERLYEHFHNKLSALRKQIDFVKLFGEQHFKIIELEKFSGTKKQLIKREEEITLEYMKKYNLLNRKFGNKISIATKQNLSKALTGVMANENHPFYGKHHSEETKKKISKKLKNVPFTESHKQHLKEATKGKTGHKVGVKLSESHKKNISKSHIGIPMPKKSRKAFIEYNKDRNKPIIDMNTNIQYKNIKDASIKLNIPIKDIRDNLHNRNTKYNFKFVEDL